MRSRQRIRDGIKYGMLYTFIIMLAGTIIVEVFASPFAKVFGLSGETQTLCISAMRVISISFIFAGANIAFQGIFQALEGGLESLIVSVCRQFLFVLPVAYLFARLLGDLADMRWVIWMTFPIAEVLSAVIAFGMMRRIRKKIALLKEN